MNKNNEQVITRFAPSPTGLLHAGTYRTAIFSYLFARKHGGKFILRIEDTDKERSKKEFEDNILDSLKWLGLTYDSLFRQSENVSRHKGVLEQMIASRQAYVSKELAKDGSGVQKEIVRFKNPNIDVTFSDLVKGEVTMHTADLGDFVIAKNINEPLFHLAVVVDDFDEGVTHVIRGDDHVSNTPRQILIQRAIGAPTPIYVHLPLVLGTDKQKLSKRRGARALTGYRDDGYLAQAILNMVALIGWNPGTEQEVFTHDDLVAGFTIERIQKSAGVFNPEKLEWVNREHIKLLSKNEQLTLIDQFMPESIKKHADYDTKKSKMAPVIIDRIGHFGEIAEMHNEGELEYFFVAPTYPKEKLLWKDDNDEAKLLERLGRVVTILHSIDEKEFTADVVKIKVFPYADEEGRGKVLWPMRFALSGREKSPDPFQLAEILGKNETIQRIDKAVSLYATSA